jgi:diguanylate cyclase (GGDEF)-like protein
MNKILIVEDSRNLAAFIQASVKNDTGLSGDIALSYAEAEKLLDENEYFAAVTDLNLPDAPAGAMVETLIERNIPTIVYTGDYSDELRVKIWKKKIVDYVIKRDPESDKYVSRLIGQLCKNINIDVLIVDDSIILRNSMKRLLEAHLFRVHAFGSANEALEQAGKLENLKLVISDYMMPDMDGFEFVRNIRKNYTKDKVAFIGVSGTAKEEVSAKFIKFGANDFMMKPFSHEQFYTRVNQNLQMMLMIENILDLSNKDFLTGLYNRRYFFIEMDRVFDKNAEKTVCIMDIDHFKRVNDTYGHDGGDAVLKLVARLLKAYVGKKGFVSRFGGEEFCIYLSEKVCGEFFEGMRRMIEDSVIDFDGVDIKITASFGVTSVSGKSVDAMITEADSLLYDAKTSGRNRVISIC